MNGRGITTSFIVAVFVGAMVIAPVSASSGLSREEKALLERMQDACRHFEILRLEKAAGELKAILASDPSTVFARRLRAAATKEMLADMRGHEELRSMVDVIIKLAAKGDAEVLEDPAFFKELLDNAVSDNLGRRTYAYEDLRTLGQFTVPPLLAMLLDTRDVELRTRIVRAISEVGSGATLPLVEALASDNHVLRQNTVLLLGDARDARAVPALVQLYHNTGADRHKAVIVDSLRKIAGMEVEGIPTVQAAYRVEAERALSGGRDYATSPSRDWAPLWSWDASAGELAMEKVPRELYRELTARRMIQRGLAAGYSGELTELVAPLYLRIAGKLGDDDDSELRSEADRVMHIAGAPAMFLALGEAVKAGDRVRILIALDVLHDLGRYGVRLVAADDAAGEEAAMSAGALAWRSALEFRDVDVQLSAARTAVAMRRDLTDAAGGAVVRTLLANMRFPAGVGRVLVVVGDSKLATEIAALVTAFPAECTVAPNAKEGAQALARMGDCVAVVVHFKELGLVERIKSMGLEGVVSTVCLVPMEDEILYQDKADEVAILPLGTTMFKRKLKQHLPPCSDADERAADALAHLVEAIPLAALEPDCFAGMLGDLAVRQDKAFRMNLLSMLAHAGDAEDLRGVFNVIESEDYSKEERVLALSVAGKVLDRHPSQRTADMKSALAALFRSGDEDLSCAAACVLNVVESSDEDFAETFNTIVAPEGGE